MVNYWPQTDVCFDTLGPSFCLQSRPRDYIQQCRKRQYLRGVIMFHKGKLQDSYDQWYSYKLKSCSVWPQLFWSYANWRYFSWHICWISKIISTFTEMMCSWLKHMCQRTESSLDHVMTWCLLNINSSSETMLACGQLDYWEKITVKCESKYKTFLLMNCIWKHRLQKFWPVQAWMC